MILTYKLRHNVDFSEELAKARKVAEYAIKHRTFSSKDVKHIGLKSAISNQILRKYGRNKKARQVKNIKLTIPNQSIKLDRVLMMIGIPCLKRSFEYRFPHSFEKINQIEIGEEYAYVSVLVKEKEYHQQCYYVNNNGYLGVDLNTTGHIAVISNPDTGKVWKLGKIAEHIHTKYKHIRKGLQKRGKYRKVKQIKNRESRIVRNLNHYISKKIVETAISAKSGIRLEKLQDIRKSKRHVKRFRYSLNSWSFYQLQKFVEYKAKLQGIIVEYIDPRYTSKTCSKCGHIGKRDDKRFECPNGHVDHGDVNASFNIGKPISYCVISTRDQFNVDRDTSESSTDTLKGATVENDTDTRTPKALA
jgi:putative transposase